MLPTSRSSVDHIVLDRGHVPISSEVQVERSIRQLQVGCRFRGSSLTDVDILVSPSQQRRTGSTPRSYTKPTADSFHP